MSPAAAATSAATSAAMSAAMSAVAGAAHPAGVQAQVGTTRGRVRPRLNVHGDACEPLFLIFVVIVILELIASKNRRSSSRGSKTYPRHETDCRSPIRSSGACRSPRRRGVHGVTRNHAGARRRLQLEQWQWLQNQ